MVPGGSFDVLSLIFQIVSLTQSRLPVHPAQVFEISFDFEFTPRVSLYFTLSNHYSDSQCGVLVLLNKTLFNTALCLTLYNVQTV